jgi:hypothetical protein
LEQECSSNAVISARVARILIPGAALVAAVLGKPNDAVAIASGETATFNASLDKHFPGSLPNSVVVSRLVKGLAKRGYKPSNTLLGSSLCSDEINSSPSSLAPLLESKFSKGAATFELGGLGGIPFVGVSGMKAFASHCPQNGKILIVFGPHVGISKDGVVGEVERPGQEDPSRACGAALAAYDSILKSKSSQVQPDSVIDFQEDYIKLELASKLGALPLNDSSTNDKNANVTIVTRIMYDIIWDLLRKEVDMVKSTNGFWSKVKDVTLLGGIIINHGHDGEDGEEDFFQPISFMSQNVNGETNLYDNVFGDLSSSLSRG